MTRRVIPAIVVDGVPAPERDHRLVPASTMALYENCHPETIYRRAMAGQYPAAGIERFGKRELRYRPAICLSRVAVVLAFALSLPAAEHIAIDRGSEWYDASASHHGKHGLGGIAIGAVAYTSAAFVTDEREERYAAAVICGVAVGVGYELVEGRDGKSYADPVDALWVAAGALIGAAVVDLTDQSFAITPQRHGAAIAVAWRF